MAMGCLSSWVLGIVLVSELNDVADVINFGITAWGKFAVAKNQFPGCHYKTTVASNASCLVDQFVLIILMTCAN